MMTSLSAESSSKFYPGKVTKIETSPILTYFGGESPGKSDVWSPANSEPIKMNGQKNFREKLSLWEKIAAQNTEKPCQGAKKSALSDFSDKNPKLASEELEIVGERIRKKVVESFNTMDKEGNDFDHNRVHDMSYSLPYYSAELTSSRFETNHVFVIDFPPNSPVSNLNEEAANSDGELIVESALLTRSFESEDGKEIEIKATSLLVNENCHDVDDQNQTRDSSETVGSATCEDDKKSCNEPISLANNETIEEQVAENEHVDDELSKQYLTSLHNSLASDITESCKITDSSPFTESDKLLPRNTDSSTVDDSLKVKSKSLLDGSSENRQKGKHSVNSRKIIKRTKSELHASSKNSTVSKNTKENRRSIAKRSKSLLARSSKSGHSKASVELIRQNYLDKINEANFLNQQALINNTLDYIHGADFGHMNQAMQEQLIQRLWQQQYIKQQHIHLQQQTQLLHRQSLLQQINQQRLLAMQNQQNIQYEAIRNVDNTSVIRQQNTKRKDHFAKIFNYRKNKRNKKDAKKSASSKDKRLKDENGKNAIYPISDKIPYKRTSSCSNVNEIYVAGIDAFDGKMPASGITCSNIEKVNEQNIDQLKVKEEVPMYAVVDHSTKKKKTKETQLKTSKSFEDLSSTGKYLTKNSDIVSSDVQEEINKQISKGNQDVRRSKSLSNRPSRKEGGLADAERQIVPSGLLREGVDIGLNYIDPLDSFFPVGADTLEILKRNFWGYGNCMESPMRGRRSDRSSMEVPPVGAGGGDDVSSVSSESYSKDVAILNCCFDDIERFIARLQHTAAATHELERRRRSRKNKKKDIGDGLLSMRAKAPPEIEFIEILQKFKLSFNMLGKLRTYIHEPNAPELVHFLFTPLALIVDASRDNKYGDNLPAQVVAPLLTREAIDLLTNCLSSRETELWQSLEEAWTTSKDAWKYHVDPYQPVFSSGWAPELTEEGARELRGDHMKHQRGHREVDDYYPGKRATPPGRYQRNTYSESEVSGSESASGVDSGSSAQWLSELRRRDARVVQVIYPRTANNEKELTVMRGEFLEVVDDSRKWWKCGNSRGHVAHVPHTIVTPYTSDSVQEPVGPPLSNDWMRQERPPMKGEFGYM